MARDKFPHEVFVRVNRDSGESFLELSESINDVPLNPGDSAEVAVYVLKTRKRVKCRIEVDG